MTWLSYNRWPQWRSLYDLGSAPWGANNAQVGYDVGFDRPYALFWNGFPAGFHPLTNGSGEFLMTEFPLAFWLEKEGYDVTYISNVDTHADGKGLLRAKAFLSVGHDEYWTERMFENVTTARDAGVSLAFLSGNSISGVVELLPSSDGRPNRVMRRAGRGFQGEQELMGATSYGVGFADWTSDRPEHWAFEGTNMRKGDRVAQLVGWEYHGAPLGKHPDLVVLSEGPVYGNNGERRSGTLRDDDLHGGERQSRLQRRHVLVEHGALHAARVPEPAAQGLHAHRRAHPADHEEHPRPDDRREDRPSALSPTRERSEPPQALSPLPDSEESNGYNASRPLGHVARSKHVPSPLIPGLGPRAHQCHDFRCVRVRRSDRSRRFAGLHRCIPGATANTQEPEAAGRGGRGGQTPPPAPRPYAQVITDKAKTDDGIFKVHRIGDQLFYEIPKAELGKDFLWVRRSRGRRSAPATADRPRAAGWCGGSSRGDRVLLMNIDYSVVADPTNPIAQAVGDAEQSHHHPRVQRRGLQSGWRSGDRRHAALHDRRARVFGARPRRRPRLRRHADRSSRRPCRFRRTSTSR